MICVVQRQFPGPDGNFAVGTEVDTSTWRPMNVESLIRNRFLQPVAFVKDKSKAAPPGHKPGPPVVKKLKKQRRVFDE